MANTLLLLALLAFLGGQAFGQCPRVQPMKSFSGFQTVGKWYVNDWLTPFQDEKNLRCVECNLWPNEVGSFSVNMTGVPLGKITRASRNEGRLHLRTPTVPAEMTASWRGRAYKYVVMDTDYNTYATISACSKSEENKVYEYMAIMSRRRQLDPKIHLKLKEQMKRNGLIVGRMRAVDQTCNE